MFVKGGVRAREKQRLEKIDCANISLALRTLAWGRERKRTDTKRAQTEEHRQGEHAQKNTHK